MRSEIDTRLVNLKGAGAGGTCWLVEDGSAVEEGTGPGVGGDVGPEEVSRWPGVWLNASSDSGAAGRWRSRRWRRNESSVKKDRKAESVGFVMNAIGG